MPGELIAGRFENVSCGHAARWNTPAASVPEQCSLGLCSGETELAGIVLMSPCGSIPRKLAQSHADFLLTQPLNGRRPAREHRFNALGTHVLNRPRAVFADVLQERERRVGANAV